VFSDGLVPFVSILDAHTKNEVLRVPLEGHTANYMSFAPDDTRVLAHMNKKQDIVIDCRNGSLTNIKGGLQTKWVGNRLLGFVRIDGGAFLFSLLDMDKGATRVVYNGGPNVSCWDWSPDGRYLVFGREGMGGIRFGFIPWPGPDLVLVNVSNGRNYPLGLIGVIGERVVKPNAIIWTE